MHLRRRPGKVLWRKEASQRTDLGMSDGPALGGLDFNLISVAVKRPPAGRIYNQPAWHFSAVYSLCSPSKF
ncbi:hypothetical protein K469DRAFT_711996 [Zopfia rhizophila CBS 207.26]|uniref:Uncharacterized protein n=1 Tax=Zopfia rhizophila CBS 207.26 TaxID=1314779 RepID=A0A6A6DUG7_9PEZI|nr:hypothetical protein K469DRAFT_711996 [Zopfia rhizophila CBS 207.26]